MATSYLNIVTFLLSTIVYYMVLKPNLKYETLVDPEKFKKFTSNSYMYLACYMLLVIVVQFIVNSYVITSSCGGNITDNMGSAGVYTFIPWTFIFGAVVIVLLVYPGFKTAFSDVIGYFYVSSSTNKVLTDLLIEKDVQQKLDSDPNITPHQKAAMEDAADTIIKIVGNTSILINQIVPSNFDSYWKILTPLMKDKYQNNSPESIDMKNKLFDLVVTRDNVGEAMWFIYTGVLLTSIVQLKISSQGCVNSPQTMEKNYQAYLQQEQQAQQAQQQATSTTYTITN